MVLAFTAVTGYAARAGRARSPQRKGGSMARRPNYGGEKRQKEIQRQKKKEEKDEKKRLKKEAAAAGDQSTAGEESESDLDEYDRDEGD